jgi:hypothetical protein
MHTSREETKEFEGSSKTSTDLMLREKIFSIATRMLSEERTKRILPSRSSNKSRTHFFLRNAVTIEFEDPFGGVELFGRGTVSIDHIHISNQRHYTRRSAVDKPMCNKKLSACDARFP